MFLRFQLLLAALAIGASFNATGQRINAGPMLGSNQLREVSVWLQTDKPAEVWLRYWPKDSKQPAVETAHVTTTAQKAHTALLICPLLEPGQAYSYEVVLNGLAQRLDVPTEFTTQSLWQYRLTPPRDWCMALGSCTYINETAYDRQTSPPYGASKRIFESIAEQEPEVMLWLGDNIYLREADLHSWSGMLHRYTHTRQIPELQPLLATAHHIAIWDDHDFGPNDSNFSWIHKDRAKEAFELFWANESYGTSELPGITSQMQYNDVDFFLLDNRWERTSPDATLCTPQVLGNDQVEWLIQALKSSVSPFKLVAVGGQFLNDVEKYENMSHYPEERARILKGIADHNIQGVVFLTGDRHCTELSRMEVAPGVVVHDLTCSPLTSKAYDNTDEENSMRIPGSIVATQNFGMLSFSGTIKERRMAISIHDFRGNEIWTYGIYADGTAPLGLLDSSVKVEPALDSGKPKQQEPARKPRK